MSSATGVLVISAMRSISDAPLGIGHVGFPPQRAAVECQRHQFAAGESGKYAAFGNQQSGLTAQRQGRQGAFIHPFARAGLGIECVNMAVGGAYHHQSAGDLRYAEHLTR